MSREIKFRAWDGKGMITSLRLEIETGKTYRSGEYQDYEEIWPLMQYTGLNDKNGVDWYEGDIIQCIDPEDASTAVIVFEGSSWRKKYKDWDDSIPSPIIDDLDLKWFIYIGNIHQHPELLNAEGD